VEALASGVPCVTSNEGGPQEIIVPGECGLVFDPGIDGDLEDKVYRLAADPDRLQAFKAKARERALHFTYDRSADAFWELYRKYHRNQIP
jgi:glycosyltransferase involved in cell wall biosynthesis